MVLTAIPLYHIFALTVNGILMFNVGAKNILITNPRDMKAFTGELKKHQITIFTGVNTDQCVMTTLQNASFLGYDCILLRDCTATLSPEFCSQATFYNVEACFGFVTNSEAFLEAISLKQETES